MNQSPCTDDVSLNFSNAVISTIEQDFISSPIISCLNFTGNNIQNIGRGAFNKLPNLTHLFLSNNQFRPAELFNFGSHDKLQVLIMNNATNMQYSCSRNSEIVYIPGEYPNLEILSLRKNCFNNLGTFTLKETPFSEFFFPNIRTILVLSFTFNKLLSPSLLSVREYTPLKIYYQVCITYIFLLFVKILFLIILLKFFFLMYRTLHIKRVFFLL